MSDRALELHLIGCPLQNAIKLFLFCLAFVSVSFISAFISFFCEKLIELKIKCKQDQLDTQIKTEILEFEINGTANWKIKSKERNKNVIRKNLMKNIIYEI